MVKDGKFCMNSQLTKSAEKLTEKRVYKKNAVRELAFFLPSLFILAFVVVLIIYLKTKDKVNYLEGKSLSYMPTIVAVSIILVGAIVIKVLRIMFAKLIITPEQIVVKTGVLFKKTQIIDRSKVYDVSEKANSVTIIYSAKEEFPREKKSSEKSYLKTLIWNK